MLQIAFQTALTATVGSRAAASSSSQSTLRSASISAWRKRRRQAWIHMEQASAQTQSAVPVRKLTALSHASCRQKQVER